jgi:hypothetical protein
MGGMFYNLPIKVFPHRQNQCFTWKNHQFPAIERRVNSRGMGTFAKIYIRLPPAWNKRMDARWKYAITIFTVWKYAIGISLTGGCHHSH